MFAEFNVISEFNYISVAILSIIFLLTIDKNEVKTQSFGQI